MAKQTRSNTVTSFKVKGKKKRPGIHSKKKTSVLKSSKNYKKLYVGQG